MKVANITAMAINQGFTAGFPNEGEVADAPPIAQKEKTYFAFGTPSVSGRFRNPRLKMNVQPITIATKAMPTLMGE